ncbi:MAG TPA: hypothetical protein PKK95_04060 [Vicinamibacterales bacterium]|nr:hypothetical protein [Vicinamibacterales bacterium]
MARRGMVAALVVFAWLGAAAPARADITAFLGLSTTPGSRQARGLAIGGGVLALGFEFEYSDIAEDAGDLEPGLRVGSVNGLLQTPIALGGAQLYVTAGAGVYRERLGGSSETSLAVNLGGGAKIRLLGPLRLRLDYRLFSLRGDPLHDRYHRLYAGANLGF